MTDPMQVRFEDAAKDDLERRGSATKIAQVDLVRLAVDELFKRYPSDALLLKAYMKWRLAKGA